MALKNRLSRVFYEQDDVVKISRELLGKVLCSQADGVFTSAIITETEAYRGRNDKACHANNGLRTKRTEIMYGSGGYAYIYLCYGMYHLLNVVTNRKGLADAVLIRAVLPVEGIEHMVDRRVKKNRRSLTDGPGKLSQAMGIHTRQNGTDLCGDHIWIEDRGIEVNPSTITAGPRVGIDYAGDDALLPWRFIASEI